MGKGEGVGGGNWWLTRVVRLYQCWHYYIGFMHEAPRLGGLRILITGSFPGGGRWEGEKRRV